MKRVVLLTLVILSLLLVVGAAAAEPPAQEEEGRPYVVQPGDGLIKLAKLFFGDGEAFTRIVEATNALAASDSSYREITDANIILVGEKLWIPGLAELPTADAAEVDAAESAPAAEEEMSEEDAPTMEDETSKVGSVPLAGTRWMMTSLNGKSPLPATTISLEFVDEMTAGGTSGCNNYSTSYELDGIKISFGPMAGTLKACPEPVMAQEQAYRQALADAAFYEVSDQGLALYDANTTQLVTFEAAATGLAGTAWDVISYNNGREAVVSVKIDTAMTAVFAEDGQLSGSAGCNNYFGPYTTDGDAISIGPLASTRKLCADEELMAQEAAYLTALETAATYKITGSTMEMRTESGAMAANFTLAEQAVE